MPSKFTPKYLQISLLLVIGALAYAIGYHRGNNRGAKTSDKELQPKSEEVADIESAATNLQPLPNTEIHELEYQSEFMDAPEYSNFLELGRNEARADLEAALEKARTLQGSDLIQYVSGMFSFVARNSSPRDALTIANSQEGPLRVRALQTLVSEWTGQSQEGGSTQYTRMRRMPGSYGGRFGIEAELASVIARSNANPEIAEAWIESFSNHPSRSEIVARLAPADPNFNPSDVLSHSRNWTDWERSRFEESLMQIWAQQEPSAAWSWVTENPNSTSANASQKILETWAQRDSKGLAQSLDEISNLDQRDFAIEALSRSLARRSTDQALDWVESLSDENERANAYQAVYDSTPKGIGAMLQIEGGFPKIGEILPGGALESTSIRAGDLIVESREANGAPQSLYGVDLRNTVDHLRGAPGSEVEITVLRENPDTGELEQHTVNVVRDLLILKGEPRR